MACAAIEAVHRRHRVGEPAGARAARRRLHPRDAASSGPVTGAPGRGLPHRAAHDAAGEGDPGGAARARHPGRHRRAIRTSCGCCRRSSSRKSTSTCCAMRWRILPAMKRFLDLADFARERGAGAARARAAPARRTPSRRRSPARSSACCSSIPRCARWPRSRPAWRGWAAAPSSSRRARAPGSSRRASARSMNGAAAEHVREGIPVLASYCDALGIRAFADGKDLAQRSRRDRRSTPWPRWSTSRSSTSSRRSTIPARRWPTGRRWTTSACRGTGKFVLSWVYHPRALPLAVPAAAVHMAAMRGMEVVVLRPEGFALPRRDHGQGARRAAAVAGGSVRETADRARRSQGAHVVYAKEWGSTAHYGDAAADARLRARSTDWCVRDDWFAAPRPTAASCIACRCGATPRSPTRCSTVRAASCSARPTTACRRRWPCSINCSKDTEDHTPHDHAPQPTRPLAIRALRSAAPYIRMYKGKTFVVKAGGGVFADTAATRVLIEQIAILHYFGVRVVMVHGGGPQLTEVTEALGVPTRMVRAGASPTRSRSTSPRWCSTASSTRAFSASAATWTSTRSASAAWTPAWCARTSARR